MGAIIPIISRLLGLMPTLLLIRQRATTGNKGLAAALRPVKSRNRYWGVRLVPPQFGICCKPMGQLQGRTFTMELAPRLPLPGCAMPRCHCRRQRLSERRSGSDRRRKNRLPPGQADRRSGNDRRA